MISRSSRDAQFVALPLRCEFDFEQCGNVMVLYDTDKPGKMSVTNDAENAVAYLMLRYPNPTWTRLIYRDSDGYFDELAVKNGEFVGFAPLRETTLAGALARIEATTIG